jgi:hypothetical protein
MQNVIYLFTQFSASQAIRLTLSYLDSFLVPRTRTTDLVQRFEVLRHKYVLSHLIDIAFSEWKVLESTQHIIVKVAFASGKVGAQSAYHS